MLLLSAADIEAALPLKRAMTVMRDASRALSAGTVSVAERQRLDLPAGTGLIMGAAAPGVGMVAKAVSVMPGNPGRGLPGTLGTLILCSADSGQPLALMDGTALTAWRTAALSALAIDMLARPDARQAVLIGCGTQGAAQLVAMITARRLERIQVHALHAERLAQFIGHYEPRISARLEAVSSLEAAVSGADLVVTVTNSNEPVFDAAHLAPGCHVNGIGSFRADMCENDPALAARARVFVESRHSARHEAGELVAAVRLGHTQAEQWIELGEVIDGQAPGRQGPEDLTFFKSVGHAVFDLHHARAVYDAARQLRLGTDWES